MAWPEPEVGVLPTIQTLVERVSAFELLATNSRTRIQGVLNDILMYFLLRISFTLNLTLSNVGPTCIFNLVKYITNRRLHFFKYEVRKFK